MILKGCQPPKALLRRQFFGAGRTAMGFEPWQHCAVDGIILPGLTKCQAVVLVAGLIGVVQKQVDLPAADRADKGQCGPRRWGR